MCPWRSRLSPGAHTSLTTGSDGICLVIFRSRDTLNPGCVVVEETGARTRAGSPLLLCRYVTLQARSSVARALRCAVCFVWHRPRLTSNKSFPSVLVGQVKRCQVLSQVELRQVPAKQVFSMRRVLCALYISASVLFSLSVFVLPCSLLVSFPLAFVFSLLRPPLSLAGRVRLLFLLVCVVLS